MLVCVFSIRYAEVLAHAYVRLQDKECAIQSPLLQWDSKVQTPYSGLISVVNLISPCNESVQ